MPKRTRIPAAMTAALKTYEQAATEILQDFVTAIEATPPPPMIYHYTSDTGLQGIIESGKLRFSDIFGLNDPTELRHGLKVAIDVLKSKIDDARPEIATFASQLERFDVDAGIEAAGHFFASARTGGLFGGLLPITVERFVAVLSRYNRFHSKLTVPNVARTVGSH